MKNIKTEIKKYLNENIDTQSKINKNRNEQKILDSLPKNLKKGIKDIEIKNQTIYIKTKTPSWRQETTILKNGLFFEPILDNLILVLIIFIFNFCNI